ncbi:MAG TPA: aldehyde reductase, partial [Thermoleophilia bacterium]|nr:aldehyde reductase [Thermoleophilia bacterium]
TSSFAAIGYGRPAAGRPFTEEDWTDPNAPGVRAYAKSKTLAERAAWDFVHRGAPPELAVVNPVGVLGPVLGPDLSPSIMLVKAELDGTTARGAPRLYFNVVDARDVADLHVRAMTDPTATGQRFLAVADGPVSMKDVADVLRAHLGAAASRVPTRVLPDWQLRLAGLVDRRARDIVPDLGKVRAASNEKARRVLGWEPRTNDEAIVATAESLIRLGLVGASRKAA